MAGPVEIKYGPVASAQHEAMAARAAGPSVLDRYMAGKWKQWDMAVKEAERQVEMGLLNRRAADAAAAAALVVFNGQVADRQKRVDALEDALVEFHVAEDRSVKARELVQDEAKVDAAADAAARRQSAMTASAQLKAGALQFSAGEKNESERLGLRLAAGDSGGGGAGGGDDVDGLYNMIKAAQGAEGIAGMAPDIVAMAATNDPLAFAQAVTAELYNDARTDTSAALISPTESAPIVGELINKWAVNQVARRAFPTVTAATDALAAAGETTKGSQDGPGAFLLGQAVSALPAVRAGAGGGSGSFGVTLPQGAGGYKAPGVGAVGAIDPNIRAYAPGSDAEMKEQLAAARGDLAALQSARPAAAAPAEIPNTLATARALYARHFGPAKVRNAFESFNPARLTEGAQLLSAQQQGTLGGVAAPPDPVKSRMAAALAASLSGQPPVPIDTSVSDLVTRAVQSAGYGKGAAQRTASALIDAGLDPSTTDAALRHAADLYTYQRKTGAPFRASPPEVEAVTEAQAAEMGFTVDGYSLVRRPDAEPSAFDRGGS